MGKGKYKLSGVAFREGLNELILQGCFYYYDIPKNIDFTFPSSSRVMLDGTIVVLLRDGSKFKLSISEITDDK